MSNNQPQKIFWNQVVDKKQLKKLIHWAFINYGSASCSTMADELKNMGFRYATQAGVSISVEDLQVPPSKREMLESAENTIADTEERYRIGKITEVERFQKVIDTWNVTSEALKDEVVRNFQATDPLNSVYMMSQSGARGNLSQVRQLVGMRGLMADPQGEIIDLPIKTNFREGLTVTEYIISSYGARKGLVDTALRTADSGYLTRRLVDVSQDVIVREEDCGTQRGITATSMTDGERTLIPLSDRLFGRTLAEDVVDPKTGEVIVSGREYVYDHNGKLVKDPATGEYKTTARHIDEPLADKIAATVKEVKVRSPLTCEAARSVCQCCYGWSLAHGRPVDKGEAVGIIAAQSIGEPGTQLTMRTFHTGGVFTGDIAQQVTAPGEGTVIVPKKLRTRKVRTRHGEEREQVEVSGEISVKLADGEEKTITVTPGSLLMANNGETVQAGQLIVEVATPKKRSTEKATKDVSSDLAGEVEFQDLIPEEKTDRQGNMTRTAQRGGLLWVLSGEVYNLLPGAEPVVKNGSKVEPGDILAETKLVTSKGGVVRLGSGKREIEIITASVQLDQAQIRRSSIGSGEQYVIYAANNQRFALKTTPGSKVRHGEVIAELMDDTYHTETGGIIKYAGVEIEKRGKAKNGYEVTQGGTLLWIPEECHEINKDIGLLRVEDGEYVEAGAEIVENMYCQSSGVVEVVQKNDILREIVIKSGEIHLSDQEPTCGTDQLVHPGEEIISGLTADELRYVQYLETPEGNAVLVRPVVEYTIPDEPDIPSQTSINESGDVQIELRASQRLFYKDGERVKSVNGLELMRTQLVLHIEDEETSKNKDALPISVDIELPEREEEEDAYVLQMVILESLAIRRENEGDVFSGTPQTRILVEEGQEIPKDEVVARTEICCREAGEVRGIREGGEAIRRVLVVREGDLTSIPITEAPQVEKGDLVVANHTLAKGVVAPESGKVVAIRDDAVVLRNARPYRVSNGAVLHVESGSLVQRGDNLVLLIYERSKTGDIVQGLPRIEELLEARKPREACLLARRAGTAQVEYKDDETVDVKIIEADGVISDYPIGAGQSMLITDGQWVDVGTPLTDGPPNPHEILDVFFDYYLEEQGMYEAALLSLQKVQQFLVNEVQGVYQSQGIDISDKHIEVIVRQMTSKVKVEDGGDTIRLPGELAELRDVHKDNETMYIIGGAPVEYKPNLLGITKASLNTDSFISAASFQETTRVLTEAAIEGKSDWLRGLKENVIIGRLIPAGTGFSVHEDSFGHSVIEEEANPTQNMIFHAETPPELESNGDLVDDQTARNYQLSDHEFSDGVNDQD